MLVETWLNEEEASFYNTKNYQAVHCFREGRGGGACIYVKEGIGVEAVDKSNEKSSVNWLLQTCRRWRRRMFLRKIIFPKDVEKE
nr:unnamed protein product [Callosobruchus analis]